MEKVSIYESIVTENKGIESFYAKDCLENNEGGEWNILIKIHVLEF